MFIRVFVGAATMILGLACSKGGDKADKPKEPASKNDDGKTGKAPGDQLDTKPPTRGPGGESAGGGIDGVGGGSPRKPPPDYVPPKDTRTKEQKQKQIKIATLEQQIQVSAAKIAEGEMQLMQATEAMQRAKDDAAKQKAAEEVAKTKKKIEEERKRKAASEKALAELKK